MNWVSTPAHTPCAPPSTPAFDRLAKPYRWLEYASFGPLLQQTRTHWLPSLSQCRTALILGDGDGRFTAALLQANPQIRVHAVDASPAMLEQLLRRADASRITVEAADLRTWRPPSNHHFDLVTSHFFLDCLTTEEVDALARRIAPALTPQATWIVSDFAVPATPYGRWIAAPIVTALYLAFRALTGLSIRRLPDHATALERHGWIKQSEAQRLSGLLMTQLWTSTPHRESTRK